MTGPEIIPDRIDAGRCYSAPGAKPGHNGFNSFIWVIDAHPEDVDMVDYVRPNGEKVMRTIADYRQLTDALFHAGTNSGSQYEGEDTSNRLHFYVIDLQPNPEGILSYTLGVRSLDGAGPQQRGVALAPPSAPPARTGMIRCDFTLKNTGKAEEKDPALLVAGKGWSAKLPNELAAVKFGESQPVAVYLTRESGAASAAAVTLKATSESDPAKTATATYRCLPAEVAGGFIL